MARIPIGPTTARVLVLDRGEWILGEPIGSGGFGRVFEASSGQLLGAAKLIPKDPGAERELLFVDLGSARNVVPAWDTGETDDSWVIVMPRADTSLRAWLMGAAGPVGVEDALPIFTDLITALADLDGSVVHRDLKPENVLRLGDSWCLSDFGISRYAEATTAPDTRKFSMTPEYAAPERWRTERATSAADVYSFGVMAYELLHGARPFLGPTVEDLREQHLHSKPEPLSAAPALVSALVDECLLKAPGARPTPLNLLARIERASAEPSSPGLARLQGANRAEVSRRAEADRRKSEEQTAEERRAELYDAAARVLGAISTELLTAIENAAPAVRVTPADRGQGWGVKLGESALSYSGVSRLRSEPWAAGHPPAFEVIASAKLAVRIPADRYGYEGRSHSLWFCDAQETGGYRWFETAFMISPLMQQRRRESPFALAPGEEAAKALWRGVAEYQVAWPFTPLEFGSLDDWIDRWAGWLSEASEGRLHHPSRMPEKDTAGTWRQSSR